jgi:hypothetical protein
VILIVVVELDVRSEFRADDAHGDAKEDADVENFTVGSVLTQA